MSIKFVASTIINSYLLRKKELMTRCIFSPLAGEGVENLFEICGNEVFWGDGGGMKDVAERIELKKLAINHLSLTL